MKQYITLLLCLLTSFCFSQDKRVHLVHGLGGDSDSWADFSSELEQKCPGLEVTTFASTSNQGLAQYSQEFTNSLNSIGVNPNDIAIGHSFGGLNLRNLDQEGLFGAYITIGSVHEGSPLANAALDGTFDLWVQELCKEVIADPITAIIETTPWINIPNLFENEAERIFCDKVHKEITKLASDFTGNFQSVEDLKVGGLVASLDPASIPAISYVCTIDGHPLWNLLEGHPSDLPWNNYANNMEAGARATSNIFRTLAILTPSPWQKLKYRKAGRECRESYLFLQGTEATWNELIGAGGTVTYTYTPIQEWICDCYDINTGQPIPCNTFGADIELLPLNIDPATTCSQFPDCWQDSNTSFPTFGPDLPSDGLIPDVRQLLPNAMHDEYIDGVSHFDQPGDEGIQNLILEHINPITSLDQSFNVPNCL